MLAIGNNPAYSEAMELCEQVIDGYRRFHVLKAAVDLEFFPWLAQFGPASQHRIAEAMCLNERYLGPFLHTLVEDGFLDRRGMKLALTDASVCLFTAGAPIKLPQLLARLRAPNTHWEHLSAMLQSRGEQIGGGGNDVHGGLIVPGDYFHTERAVRNWPQFENATSMFDLGGTGGALSMALCKHHPALRATILVEPGESEALQRQIAVESLADRIAIVEGDLMSVEFDERYDIVLAVHCLYAFQKRLLTVMEKIAGGVREHGLLVMQHWFQEGHDPQWQNGVRALDQEIHRSRQPLRHSEAFADRVTSAGFCWVKEGNLHEHKDGVQLRLAQRCNECDKCNSCEPTCDAKCVALEVD